MTTIAYNHKDKQLAVDSRTTCGGIVASDKVNKTREVNGVLFIGAGLPHDINQLIDAYPNQCVDADYGAIVYAIDSGKVFRFGQTAAEGWWVDEVLFSRADGSGEQFALAAMDFGCSAKDAVKYAMTRDICTGGKVKVINLK